MPDEVLEWMIAARLHPYIHLIREKDLYGKNLRKLNENTLMVIYLITSRKYNYK